MQLWFLWVTFSPQIIQKSLTRFNVKNQGILKQKVKFIFMRIIIYLIKNAVLDSLLTCFFVMLESAIRRFLHE